KGSSLTVCFGGVANDVLKRLHIIAGMQQVGVLVVDFLDAAGGYLVVEAFNFKTDLLQVVDNVIAHGDGLVIGSDREVAVVNTDLVAAVGASVHYGFLAGAPPTFI